MMLLKKPVDEKECLNEKSTHDIKTKKNYTFRSLKIKVHTLIIQKYILIF